MIKDGAGEDQSIEQRNRDADGDSLIEIAQHAAGGGAVDVQNVSVASKGCGDDEGLAVDNEADMAKESFIEDLIDGVAVVYRALRFAHYTRAWSWSGVAAGHGI